MSKRRPKQAPGVPEQPRSRRGRPRKFGRPSTAITLTLPDDTVAALQGIDTDLGRAIVRLAQPLTARPRKFPELSFFGDRAAIVVVPPRPSLSSYAGVRLIPLWDGRAIVSFDDDVSLAELELRLNDALSQMPLSACDRSVFRQLAGLLASERRTKKVRLIRQSIVLVDGDPSLLMRDAPATPERLPVIGEDEV